jgi:hypothetical protein
MFQGAKGTSSGKRPTFHLRRFWQNSTGHKSGVHRCPFPIGWLKVDL